MNNNWRGCRDCGLLTDPRLFTGPLDDLCLPCREEKANDSAVSFATIAGAVCFAEPLQSKVQKLYKENNHEQR